MNTIELLNVVLANRIADIHICMPGIIIEYDYTKQRAKVQPSLNQKYNDDEIVELPIIHNVPVIHPSSGGASITFPVNKGDSVSLHFSERSLEEWLSVGGKNVTPDDPRQNNLTDAIAYIGLNPFSVTSPAENNTDLLIKYGGSKIKLKPGGVVDIESTTININATDVNLSGKLTAENVEATSELKGTTGLIGGKDFATHTHSGVTPGPGVSGPVN
tara:strand:- start:3120 stop:3767 length:648 start_codon:yes stop_codon:yes gene_type:complete